MKWDEMRCSLALKDFPKAREDAQAARALQPEAARAWYILGRASEHFDEAKKPWKRLWKEATKRHRRR